MGRNVKLWCLDSRAHKWVRCLLSDDVVVINGAGNSPDLSATWRLGCGHTDICGKNIASVKNRYRIIQLSENTESGITGGITEHRSFLP